MINCVRGSSRVPVVAPGRISNSKGTINCVSSRVAVVVLKRISISKGTINCVRGSSRGAVVAPKTISISKGDKKKKPERKEFHTIYNYLVKKVHSDTRVSSEAMSTMNLIINSIWKMIVAEASSLAHYNENKITNREIQSAVEKLLPGLTGYLAVAQGYKALYNYMYSRD